MRRRWLWGTVLLAVVLHGCLDTCGHEVFRDLLSPDGQRHAVLFQRDCGATPDFSTQVSILPAGEQISGGGNTLVADRNHGAVQSRSVSVSWAAPDHLEISYPAKARVFLKRERITGVRITYTAYMPSFTSGRPGDV